MKFRIEASDLEYAYNKAERLVKRMEGGASCMDIECVEQVY